jgi:hypothetical protein
MREITVIGGLQIALVVLGWCALGVVLKFNGYPDDNPFVRWTPLAAWLREYGVWLLLVSPVWTGIAIVLHPMEDRVVLNAVIAATGPVLALGIFFLFLVAALDPYTRPLLIKVL